MTDTAQALISTLRGFGISATVADVQTGAAVDRYALQLAPGTQVKAVMSKADDLALAIAAVSVRVYPIPGTKHVGVEVPAAERKTVPLASISEGMPDAHPLRFPVGVDAAGKGISARVDKLPHLIVAGQTGSGKSVFMTSLLAHLVTHAEPERLQLILIDPKRVELAAFAGIRHLARPVVTDVQMGAVEALDAAVAEMDARWQMLEAAGRKNVADLEDPPPYLLVVIDELADLMMTAGKRVEASIVRLLQLGRAAGIHLILATQRPSTDVITGLIKTNAPSRMVFSVSSHTDSNVALGQSGAERLLGQGDGLWWPAGASQPERIQGAFLSDDELEEMLAPLKGDALHAAESLEQETERLAEPGCVAHRERNDGDHVCTCRREDGHFGAHTCRLCGLAWPPQASMRVHYAEPSHTPAEPGNDDALGVEMPTWEPTDDVGGDAPPRRYAFADPRRPLSESELAPSLPFDSREDQQVTDDMLIQAAYDKGRRHGQLDMEGPQRRPATGRDWAVAIALAVLAVIVGIAAIPVLPLAFGAWTAWTVVRHRTSMAMTWHGRR